MTIQIEIDEKTLAEVKKFAKTFEKSQIDYILDAINKSLSEDSKRLEMKRKEKEFIESYKKYPQQPEEYEIWQDEQVWSDE
ncbi:MAG: hypothetical protein ACR2MD_16530 [Aridibacter sp.]|jgi:hypothetical protein|nr:hypothetical protein [Acidobacteriota bacterium]